MISAIRDDVFQPVTDRCCTRRRWAGERVLARRHNFDPKRRQVQPRSGIRWKMRKTFNGLESRYA